MIRTDLRFKNIPVLLISGSFGPLDRARIESSGADGILLKPFTLATLQGKIAEVLAAASCGTV